MRNGQRNSSIEILKLIAVFLIVLSHAIPNSGGEITESYIDLSAATIDFQQLLLVLMKYMGQLGNDIFIVCSAFFLLESSRTKISKVISIVIDSFIISVLFLVAFIASGYNFSLTMIIKNMIPITMNTQWFVGCYLIFYLIHPALNVIVRSLSKKGLIALNICALFIYCGINLVIHDRFYYTQLVGFICIYFFTAYMKFYMKDFIKSKKRNIRMLVISLCMFLFSILIIDILGLKINAFSNYLVYWSIIINPFLIILSLTLFNLFNMKCFCNGLINYSSSLSLLIYMIHANMLVQDYLKMDVFSWIYKNFSYQYILLWVFAVGIILFVGGFILSVIYKETIQKLQKSISKIVFPWLKRKASVFIERLLEIT